ncbi:Serine/threonine-protein kinase [Echria macrotheca]|uniref:Serine/threonine-protein kinase n=1 Tax=Echria macrotheca TaxID=438768 RepID=A0AAJ0F1W9_9PEZI|nr:Serine/threonine-protein kinase [Echria macrotheca]
MESTYQKGKQLTLAAHGRDSGCDRITAVITEVLPDPTMSVVMKVDLQQQENPTRGRPRSVILKLYDRRFSPSLRRKYRRQYPYDEDAERAWREYVHHDKAPALFSFMREKARLEDEGEWVESDSETEPDSDDEEDKPPRTPAETFTKKGKREGIIQWKALNLWHCETRAYAKLAHLQGHCIPQLLAVVSLTVPSTPPDLSSGTDNEYFTIGGILVEYIDGFNLTDLGAQTTVPRERWHGIVQRAVDAARYINDSGVINMDCQPRNVMVDQRTLQPKHIDFAQCLFADDMDWEEFGQLRYSKGNHHAIGGVMVVKLKKTVQYEGPEIRYSERDWGRFGNALVRLRFSAWTAMERWRLGLGFGAGVGVLAWVVWRFVPVSAFRRQLGLGSTRLVHTG